MPGASIAPGLAVAMIRQDGTMTHKVRALVDSGCDMTSFPVEWAARLGIDRNTCEVISGTTAAGQDNALPDHLKPLWWQPGIDMIVFGEKIHVGAIFRPNLVPVLLGRDFFSHYLITFDDHNKRFWLEKRA